MHSQKGFSLIECLMAMAILGIIGVGILSALAMSSRSNIIADEKTTAESLVRSEMDYVKNQPYNGSSTSPTYPVISGVPSGYTVEVLANQVNVGMQKISVTVKRGTKVINTLIDYKVDR